MSTFEELPLGEVACDDMVAKLRANMPGRLAAINERFGDGLEMVAPKDHSYFTGRKDDFPEAPAIFVMEGPTKFTQEGGTGLLSEITVLVYVFESGQTGDQLATRLKRQVAAVIWSLFVAEPRERTAHGFNLAPLRTVPGQAFRPDAEHTWRGYYTVVFKVEQLELQ